ncbi:hypothetical protein BpJC7_20840 [Weizmannia acidilactici]|uniref:Uncharacterized protein n=2 Tax=Weizmannia acidilactici TaxID=2607726 RepID=A0A5J4JGG3_9BACI|nr:hypothetical protein BpJC4_25110 [Weizmannia acidilactici]GER70781.1 hypothetical protein BpJC7_20840 [Weizmannia acidilactici]GER74345.1 hypothetical protein BpPP18_24120 [Weizmannia acidilactici]
MPAVLTQPWENHVNDEIIPAVPHIDFEMDKDKVYVNGVLVLADYFEDYFGGMAFYRKAENFSPTLILAGKNPIHIYLAQMEDGKKLCIVEQKPDIE